MQKIHGEWSLVGALLVVLITLAIFISYLPAHGQVDPLPTMSSTSWAATPTMIPTMPTPTPVFTMTVLPIPTPTKHITVYLPLIVGGGPL